MAPGLGSIHQLVAKNVKLFRQACKIANKFVKGHIPVIHGEPLLQPAYARITKQSIHPAAISQHTASSHRWLSSRAGLNNSSRRLASTTVDASQSGSNNVSSRISLAISQSSGQAPFASTLRPNLTGGALPRSAGGYGLGSGRAGGRRYFSHSPEAPAQVLNNVSQAMRAFMLNGGKIHYDGCDAQSGQKRFRTVSMLQDKTRKRMNRLPRTAPGSFVDFAVNPTITALAPMATSMVGYMPARDAMETLNTNGLLDMLSIDFARALRELALVMKDLKSLASLGDLPISYQASTLRVHFPGVDPDTVECLANELNIKRGFVGQDAEFDSFVGGGTALLFPFAPGQAYSSMQLPHGQAPHDVQQPDGDSLSDLSTLSNTQSAGGIAYDDMSDYSCPSSQDLPSTISLSGLESLSAREQSYRGTGHVVETASARVESADDPEGIRQFIELCEATARR